MRSGSAGCAFWRRASRSSVLSSLSLAFDLVDLANLLQRELSELAWVCCMQVKEFAACVGQASGFRDALGKAGYVAAEVVAHQTTSPFTEEVSSVLLRSRFAEVVDHRLHVFEGSGGVRPQVSTVGAPLAGLEHGHGGFVGVQDTPLEHLILERIHQRLLLHAAHSHPLCKRGARDRQPGTRKDAFLSNAVSIPARISSCSVASQAESTRIIAATPAASVCIQMLRRWANAR